MVSGWQMVLGAAKDGTEKTRKADQAKEQAELLRLQVDSR